MFTGRIKSVIYYLPNCVHITYFIKLHVYDNNNKIALTRLIIGSPSESSVEMLQGANEAMITSISNDKSGCYLELNATTIVKGLPFQFNISSLVKVYGQDPNPFRELCKGHGKFLKI